MGPTEFESATAASEGWSTSFWSYVRADDKATFGKVSQLREDVCELYRFKTGSTIQIFMDRLDIGWGQQWTSVIEQGIIKTVFMIPIVTPSYFQSDACRQELLDFNALCERRGLTDLILPIVFSGLELISIDSPDEVARIVAEAQFEDFSEVWPYERGGEIWCLNVLRIVSQLVAAEKRVEDRLEALLMEAGQPVALPGDDDYDTDSGDGPGIAELIADVPDAARAALDALNAAGEAFQAFASAVQESPLGRGKAATAQDPRTIQRQILLSANAFKDQAVALKSAASIALDKVSTVNSLIVNLRQSFGGMNDKSMERVFLSSLGDFSSVGQVADQMQEMLRQMSDLERFSSVLRKELRPARRGIQFLRDAARLVAAWDDLSAPEAGPAALK